MPKNHRALFIVIDNCLFFIISLLSNYPKLISNSAISIYKRNTPCNKKSANSV
jgi:hypothetical protein